MRELPSCADLPIVAVTAKVGAGEFQSCLDAGASGYIPKPVENGAKFLLDLGQWLPADALGGQVPEAIP